MTKFIEVLSRDDNEPVLINATSISSVVRSTYPKTKCDIYTSSGVIIRTITPYKEIKKILLGGDND